jgi:hypothetical protein
MSTAQVSSLSLEGYLQLLDALTVRAGGGGGSENAPQQAATVRAVSAIEEHFFRVQDLRQVLLIHGLAVGKFVRSDMLRALVGQPLLDPLAPAPGAAAAAPATQPPPPAANPTAPQAPPPLPPLQAVDLGVLGWAEGASADSMQRALQQAPVLSLPRLPAAREAAGAAAAAVAPAEVAQPINQPPAPTVAAAVAPPPPTAAPAAAVHLPPAMDQNAILALLQQHGWLQPGTVMVAPAAAAPPAAAPLAAPASQQAAGVTAAGNGDLAAAAAGAEPGGEGDDDDEMAAAPEPEFEHTAWLRRQLAIFEGLAGCRASREPLGEAAAAALAGRRVAFVLDRGMEVAGARGQGMMMLPAGLFQVRGQSKGFEVGLLVRGCSNCMQAQRNLKHERSTHTYPPHAGPRHPVPGRRLPPPRAVRAHLPRRPLFLQGQDHPAAARGAGSHGRRRRRYCPRRGGRYS